MLSWFKTPKIEFISRSPEVAKLMPIVEAKDVKHAWVSAMLSDFAEQRATPDYGLRKSMHTARCPAIYKVIRTGWVLRTWQDVVVEMNGTRSSISWWSAMDQSKEIPNCGNALEAHPREAFVKHMKHWDGALDVILKVQTPWMVRIPRGYTLLEMPVALADEDRFEALPGMVDSSSGLVPLNPQMKWKKSEGKFLISAGTPLAQYVLIKNEHVGLRVSSFSEGTEDNLQRFINDHTFVKNKAVYRKQNLSLIKESK
jgi:hypothetical protein